jgi:hypothetical protein
MFKIRPNLKRIAITLFFKGIIFVAICQSTVQQLAPNYFVAGVNTNTFNFVASIGRQRADNWCWAACIQMVLNYHGLVVTQEEIVTQCFGGLYDRPGNPSDFAVGLDRWAYNTRGGVSRVYFNDYPSSSAEVVKLLAAGWPVIIGMNTGQAVGHAYVLTAIYYYLSVDAFGNTIVVPDKVVLRDPWPTNPSRQEYTWEYVANNTSQVYKVWVSDLQPSYYSMPSLPTLDEIFPQTKIENRGNYAKTVFSGLSFSIEGTSIPIFYEKKLSANKSIRGGVQWMKRGMDYQAGRNYSSKFLGFGIDYKKIYPRPYRWNWFLAGTLNYRIHSREFLTYNSYGYSRSETTEMNHIFAGIRAGGDRYTGPRTYITWDIGLGYHSYLGSLALDMNILIGHRF